MIQAKGVPIYKLLSERISADLEDPVLASHAIDAEAAKRLKEDDPEGFLVRRSEILTLEVRRFAESVAEWDHTDRPSVDYLLETAGAEP